jgi:hypothetical protein
VMGESFGEDPAPIEAVNCTAKQFQDARATFCIARLWAKQHREAEGYIIIGPDAPLGIGYFARVAGGAATASSWRECCPQAFKTYADGCAKQLQHGRRLRQPRRRAQ